MGNKIPEERNETIRKEIVDLLKGAKQTVGSLSKQVRKQEKDIVEHLAHICKSQNVIIEPDECIKCGYVFEDRVKVKKPSKCPLLNRSHHLAGFSQASALGRMFHLAASIDGVSHSFVS